MLQYFIQLIKKKDWKSYIGAETSCGQTERTETSGNRMDELCRSSRSLAKIWEKVTVFLCRLFPYGGHQLSIDIQCCRNTLEFCQTSVWQNSRFCRTEQNFVGPNFLKSLLLNYVRYYFQSLKGKKYSIYIKVLRVPTKQRDDIKSNCCHIYSSHLYSASFHPSNGYFFIISVRHLVRHSNIFCQTFIRNVRLSDRSDEFRHHWIYHGLHTKTIFSTPPQISNWIHSNKDNNENTRRFDAIPE